MGLLCEKCGDVYDDDIEPCTCEETKESEPVSDIESAKIIADVNSVKDPPSPTVTVPRDEWERMKAESEAWKMVRHASEHCSSNVIIYEVRDQITRLDSLTQPHATEGK